MIWVQSEHIRQLTYSAHYLEGCAVCIQPKQFSGKEER